MTAPEPPEVEADELAAAEEWARSHARCPCPNPPDTHIVTLLAEYNRMRAELTRTVADCGICRLGGRTVHVDDDCPRHGEGDW